MLHTGIKFDIKYLPQIGGLGVGVCEVVFSAAYGQFICGQWIFKGISKMYSIVFLGAGRGC
jgi:hypothetical protein